VTASTYPRVSPCRHCGLAVLRDNDDAWIHTTLSYVCRDRWGALRGSYADPEPPAPASWDRRSGPGHHGETAVRGRASAVRPPPRSAPPGMHRRVRGHS